MIVSNQNAGSARWHDVLRCQECGCLVYCYYKEIEHIEANNSRFSANVQRLSRGSGNASLKLRRQRNLRKILLSAARIAVADYRGIVVDSLGQDDPNASAKGRSACESRFGTLGSPQPNSRRTADRHDITPPIDCELT